MLSPKNIAGPSRPLGAVIRCLPACVAALIWLCGCGSGSLPDGLNVSGGSGTADDGAQTIDAEDIVAGELVVS